jgi:hypothetical protein
MGRYPKRRPLITYVVHIDERPVVAFRAVSQTEARELIKELWFQTELQARTATASEAEAATPLLIAANPWPISSRSTGQRMESLYRVASQDGL